MNFAKKVYLAQIITYGILITLLSLVVVFTAGLFIVSKVGNISSDKALDYALLLVLMIIASAVALGFIFLLVFQLVTSIKLYKSLKTSSADFLSRKKSRAINTTFGILSIIGGVVTGLLSSDIFLCLAVLIIPATVFAFLILDKIALSKIKKETVA